MARLPSLTDEQQAVVHHGEGHARVSAVAGSGKTATLVARVLQLLDRGVDPRRILVLMFNVSARRDFAERLQRDAAGRYAQLPDVRTFHSLGLRITQSCERRGVLPARRLITEEWRAFEAARTALEQALIGMRKADKDDLLSKERVDTFATFVGLVKSGVDSAEEVFERTGMDPELDYFLGAYERFEAARRHDGLRYYGDLVHEPVMAVHRDPAVAAWLGDHMEHVILDEYQDINEAQQHLVKTVAGRRAQVMAVGDVDQCVYEWRGARPEFMVERFFADFPGAVRYGLTHTFRFGHRLSLLADHAIAHNRGRDDSLCLSAAGTPDTRIERRADVPGAHPLPAVLDAWLAAGRSPAEAVVLVRLYSMSVSIELALLRRRIPYLLEGHETVFECKEIRALLGYLRLAAGKLFSAADAPGMLELMLKTPRLGFKNAELGGIVRALLRHPQRPDRVIRGLADNDMGHYQRSRIRDRAALWRQLQQSGRGAPAWQALREVIEETDLYGYFRWSSSTPIQADEKVQMCESLVEFARATRQSVEGFLGLVGQMQEQQVEGAGERLLITSIHRAKGLEWPLVIVPGLAEGRFPYYASADETGPVEDERRLFYVACTRAKERLVLIHPLDAHLERHEQALHERMPPPHRCVASRFLYEARLGLSDKLGAALAGDVRHTVFAPAPQTANRYLRAVNAGFEVSSRQDASAKGRPRRGFPPGHG